MRRYIAILVAVWTAVIAGSLGWNVRALAHASMDTAYSEAWASAERNDLFRRWVSGHGGVYVPVTEETPPNVNLSHIAERDVETPSGRRLALMNAAYAMRQLYGLPQAPRSFRGHLISLRPMRTENTPDAWERSALEAFEDGQDEVSGLDKLHGERYMRLARPLVVVESCLACHKHHGYKVGDIRGGISFSVPMVPRRLHRTTHMTPLVLGHAGIWALGLVGIGAGAHGIGRRVTEREEAETELAKHRDHLEDLVKERTAKIEAQRAEVEEASRMKSEFLATMSHELRTPLNSVMALSQLMLSRGTGEDPEDDAEMLQVIERNGRQLLTLINDVLDLSRIEAGRFEMSASDFAPRTVAERALSMVRPLAEAKGLRLEADLADVPAMRSDEERVGQILLNLLGNAVKFTEAGQVALSVSHAGGRVSFAVADTGVGIEPDAVPYIFEHFRQADGSDARRYEGSGLGLSISQRLAELLGGRITVSTEVGRGSTFTLALPLRTAAGE